MSARRAARRWPKRALDAALLLFAPVALMGIATTPNEHAAIGIAGTADCDGPLGVLVFALPAMAIYALGLLAALVDVVRDRDRGVRRRIVLACCTVICALLAGTIAAALRERDTDTHREACAATVQSGDARAD